MNLYFIALHTLALRGKCRQFTNFQVINIYRVKPYVGVVQMLNREKAIWGENYYRAEIFGKI